MNNDFRQYEIGYLKRQAANIKPDSKASAKEMARRRREAAINDAKKAAIEATLDSWDYVVLEMIRREDPRIQIKIGTVRSSESLLKLFCHGLIFKLDRSPTFDELERIQAFLDSAESKQYKDRLKKIMTGEVKARLNTISEIIGIQSPYDMCDLTDKGRRALQAKRAEIIKLHDQMTKQYQISRSDFYKAAASYQWALPMMLVMGLGTGAMMAYMQSVAAPSYILPVYSSCDAGFDLGGDFGYCDSFGF